MNDEDEDLRDASMAIAFVTVLYAIGLIAMWAW